MLSILLLACISSTPETTPAPTPTVEPAPAPEPAVEPEVAGEPYRLAEVVGPQGPQDAFTFWGWSPDSRYYAYELYYPGSGAVECDMVAELVVVDAHSDSYADGGHLSLGYPSIEGPCTGPAPLQQVEQQRAGLLKKFDIRSSSVEGVFNEEGGNDWIVEPPDLGFFRLSLSVTGSAEAFKTGYRLEMHEVGHAGMPKVIEPGTRRRDGVLNYALHGVFFAPDDSHVAVVVRKTTQDFEARGTSYMTNATTLFPPW